jgi:ubiquitin-like 1-activating enzyme E1 B
MEVLFNNIGDRNHFLMSENSPLPNPECQVCSNGYLVLKIDTNQPLLLLVKALQQSDVNIPGELTIQQGERLFYDIEMDDNLDIPLSQLGVKHNSQLLVTNDYDQDENQNYCIVLFIEHWDRDDIKFEGDFKFPTRPKQKRLHEEDRDIQDVKNSKPKTDIIEIQDESVGVVDLD